MISIPLGPLQNACLASNWQQMPLWTKLSPPGYKHVTSISSLPKYKPWCQCETNAYNSVVNIGRSHMYHVLRMCLLHIHQTKKVLGSSVFDSLFLESFVSEVSTLKNIVRKFIPWWTLLSTLDSQIKAIQTCDDFKFRITNIKQYINRQTFQKK
jgi:hypothetical protein